MKEAKQDRIYAATEYGLIDRFITPMGCFPHYGEVKQDSLPQGKLCQFAS